MKTTIATALTCLALGAAGGMWLSSSTAEASSSVTFEPIVKGDRCPVGEGVFGNYAVLVGPPVVPLDKKGVFRFVSVSWEAQNEKRKGIGRQYALRCVDVTGSDQTEVSLLTLPPDFLPEGSPMAGKDCGLTARPVKGKVWGEVQTEADLEVEFVFEPQV